MSRIFINVFLLFLCNCAEENARLFTLLESEQTGIDFQNTLFDSDLLNIVNYPYYYNGGGVAIGDIDNDGLQDILFTGNMVRNRLYLNKGNLKFEDITGESGVAEAQGWCTGATMVDINSDGNLDIYICRSADLNSGRRKNLLYINNGDLTFTEKGAEYGLADHGYSTQASFFDYDKDGDLDCFVINHSIQQYGAGEQYNPQLRTRQNPNFSNRLYRNENGFFTDVSDEAGIISNLLTSGLGLGISDLNNDGWPDIYVSNDYNEPDYLYINNTKGGFHEQLSKRMDVISLNSMGSDIGDYNNDGFSDVITLDMLPEGNRMQQLHSGPDNFDKFDKLFKNGFFYQYSRNMLQKNNGDGTFSEIGQLAGISNTDWSWAPLLADFDNDGNKDLFITNGYVRQYTNMDFVSYSVDQTIKERTGEKFDALKEFIAKMPPNPLPNYIFRNNGDETFTKSIHDWGFDQKTLSTGAAYADLDNDGDLEIIVNNINGYAGIYKNNAEAHLENNYIKIQLEGPAKNKNGIGTKVVLYYGNKKSFQEVYVSRGFQSSVDPVLNFGIGKNKNIDSILVTWPNDHRQNLKNIPANQLLTVTFENLFRKKKSETKVDNKPIFLVDTMKNMVHSENNFNDFKIQSLLPNFLSRQGPAMAVADVNNDGLEDIYLGGSKNNPGKIFLQHSEDVFNSSPQQDFENDILSEDTAAEFFDADLDGDMDLYVVSGGYEFDENDTALQDRLYINDGHGHFIKNKNALPKSLSSNGCIAAADMDMDGDIDVFVGGRLVPGNYPLTPKSNLLINNGQGKFKESTTDRFKGLKKMGMVTDGVWMDINYDTFPDLVVVGEWMPIKVYINYDGRLVDESQKYIKFASKGWWNSVYADDMDGDGDKDLVVGNCGLNTQFKSSKKEPMTLYHKDFDQNGSVDPILSYFIDGIPYPAVSRDDISEQLPFLKKTFLSYEAYSNATVHDLFSENQFDGTATLEAEMMQTIYLENRGNEGFDLKLLPTEAQYAPVYGITSIDADHDGHKDLLLLGNNSWTRIKFGRYNANHGVLLKGDGEGGFSYVPQFESGLKIKGDVKSLKKIKNNKEYESILIGLNDSNVLRISNDK